MSLVPMAKRVIARRGRPVRFVDESGQALQADGSMSGATPAQVVQGVIVSLEETLENEERVLKLELVVDGTLTTAPKAGHGLYLSADTSGGFFRVVGAKPTYDGAVVVIYEVQAVAK